MFGAKYSKSKFWIISIILFIVDVVLGIFIRVLEHSNEYQSQAMSLYIITLVIVIVWMNTLANRIRDYGSNPYIALLALVPLVNIILALYYGSVQYKQKEDAIENNQDTANPSLVKAVKNHAQDIAEDAKENLEEYKEEHQTRKNQTTETILTSKHEESAIESIDEDALYEQAMDEIENDTKVKSLWAKSFANSEGNDERAKALYIHYRVDYLKKISKSNDSIRNTPIHTSSKEKEIQRREMKLKNFLDNDNIEHFNRTSDITCTIHYKNGGDTELKYKRLNWEA